MIFNIFIILFGVLFRFIPHIPNFTPVGSIALFGGRKGLTLLLPLLVMLISDLFIGFYILPIMISVYLGFVFYWLSGVVFKKWYVSLVAGSTSFFIITNFSVWAFTPLYEKTFRGLLNCYYMALPFWRNEIMGTLFYFSVMVFAYRLGMSFYKRLCTKGISC